MKTEIISLNTIELTTRAFKDNRLAEATKKIMGIYQDAAAYAETKNREIAKILGEVATQESYKADGFKSVAEYAQKVFGIQRANAYALSNAGKVYNDPKVSPKLKELSPSKLVEVSKVEAGTLLKALDDGKISKDSTQKELREFANSVNPAKVSSEVINTYYAHPCTNAILDSIADELKKHFTMDDWHNLFKDYIGDESVEVHKLPKAEYEVNGVKPDRYLYFTRHWSIVVEYTKYQAPKKPKAPAAPKSAELTVEQLKAMLKDAEARESARKLAQQEKDKGGEK